MGESFLSLQALQKSDLMQGAKVKSSVFCLMFFVMCGYLYRN